MNKIITGVIKQIKLDIDNNRNIEMSGWSWEKGIVYFTILPPRII